ncbi:hypothetical protein EDF59_11142 [Novosphingobium sp. ST904]|nr:hypothetical protein EDF59_11142 [Novosphingobium sp. ST904]
MGPAISRALKRMRRERRSPESYWPARRQDRIHRPFLFLLAPPGAGSTTMASYLADHVSLAGLHSSYEGQRLVRGLMDVDRWFPEKFVDFEAVIGAWAARVAEIEQSRPVAYFLEKSPPNLVRHDELLRHFSAARVVVTNREPIANIDARLRRPLPSVYDGVDRRDVVGHLARLWVWQSGLLRDAVERGGYPLVTYEAFRSEPASLASAFGIENAAPVSDEPGEASGDRSKGHGSSSQRAQVKLLTTVERRIVHETVAAKPDLLAFFGYAAEGSPSA